jgi:carbamoyltransferase
MRTDGVIAGVAGTCAAVLVDGRIAVAIDGTRLPDAGTDSTAKAALRYCFESLGVGWPDVALLVSDRAGAPPVPPPRQIVIPRHAAHAHATVVPSGFDNAVVATFAAEGQAVRLQRGGSLQPPQREGTTPQASARSSVVSFLEAVSEYVFGTSKAIGRLAGLAPLGRPDRFDANASRALRMNRGQIEWQHAAMAHLDPVYRASDLAEHVDFHADVACWAQRLVEDVVGEQLSEWYERWPLPNLGYGGDLIANTALTTLVAGRTPFEQVFVQPVAGDAGVAVGCCFHGWRDVLGREVPPHYDYDSCLGREYPPARMVDAVAGLDSSLEVSHPADPPVAAVDLLADGLVVGLFHGRSELGSRSLGHRGALVATGHAATRQPESKPCAVVRVEDCSALFELPDISPFRLLSGMVRQRWRATLAGAVGPDSTVDVLCVTEASHPRLHRLLGRWARSSGVPMLFDIGLAEPGEPLAETPEQAISLTVSGRIDALLIDDYLMQRKVVP